MLKNNRGASMFAKLGSISAKTLAVVVVVLVGVLGASTYWQWQEKERSLRSKLQNEAERLNTVTDSALHNAMLNADMEGLEKMIKKIGRIESVKRVYIVKPDGSVFLGSDETTAVEPEVRDAVRKLGGTTKGVYALRETADGLPFMKGLSPVLAEKACMQCHTDSQEGKPIGYLGIERWANQDFEQLRAGRTKVIGMNIAAITLLLVALIFVTRAITKPLGQMAAVADKIAHGDINQHIEYQSKDEIGMLANAFRGLINYIKGVAHAAEAISQGDLTVQVEVKSEQDVLSQSFLCMSAELRQMVAKIREAAASLVSASAQIAAGNNDLSRRTQEQAASLEETASSMEEMTSTVTQNADNARQANQLAASGREQAEQGGVVAGKAVTAMAEINSSSKKIADIIGVIAVVAAEVRKLAQRSADAAKEIKGLIEDSGQKVADGSELVDASGKSLEEIVTAVKKVSDIVAEIAAASQEQAAGIEQVNKAVMQMDEVTQQNASLVEEMASASESMDEQARALQELMTFFTVDGHEAREVSGSSQARLAGRPQAQGVVGTGGSQERLPEVSRGRREASAGSAAESNGRHPVGVASVEAEDSDWREF
jgi:methyl-accepting chemotaxis protein